MKEEKAKFLDRHFCFIRQKFLFLRLTDIRRTIDGHHSKVNVCIFLPFGFLLQPRALQPN